MALGLYPKKPRLGSRQREQNAERVSSTISERSGRNAHGGLHRGLQSRRRGVASLRAPSMRYAGQTRRCAAGGTNLGNASNVPRKAAATSTPAAQAHLSQPGRANNRHFVPASPAPTATVMAAICAFSPTIRRLSAPITAFTPENHALRAANSIRQHRSEQQTRAARRRAAMVCYGPVRPLEARHSPTGAPLACADACAYLPERAA